MQPDELTCEPREGVPCPGRMSSAQGPPGASRELLLACPARPHHQGCCQSFLTAAVCVGAGMALWCLQSPGGQERACMGTGASRAGRTKHTPHRVCQALGSAWGGQHRAPACRKAGASAARDVFCRLCEGWGCSFCRSLHRGRACGFTAVTLVAQRLCSRMLQGSPAQVEQGVCAFG